MRNRNTLSFQAPSHPAQRGSVLVETAIILTLFLMVIFGIVEFGRLVWNYHTLTYAVREGAHFAAVNGLHSGSPDVTDPLIKQQVINSGVGLDLMIDQVTVTYDPPGDNTPGNKVTVNAQFQFVPATKFVGGMSMTSSSTQIILQ